MLRVMSRRGARRWAALLVFGALSLSSLSGCSRQFWRRQAEQDSYKAVTEKLTDPHWQVPRIDLTPDTRSRFHDPYNPDCSPLPPDDRAAHQYMHCVNGKKGYKSWHKFGTALSIENPQWLEPFGIAVQGADPVIGHSEVKLQDVSLPQAVELSYIHSREYQTVIEDLYLRALDLTFERFRLGVRYLGVGGTEPGSLFRTTTSADGETQGSLGSTFGISQALPTGGQMAVELANSTLWIFGSGGSSSASSLSYSLTQPLLFNAGRKIALEPLTQAERNVLYQARNLARFRQTLFTDVSSDYLQLLLQRQNILNLENNIRQLKEQLDVQQSVDRRPVEIFSDPLAKFPDGAAIPDSLRGKLTFEPGVLRWRGPMSDEDQATMLNLSPEPMFQAAAQQLVAYARNEATPLAQAELRTRLNRTQNQYENAKRAFADQLDVFKISLGLPPNIQLEIDETLLGQFELITAELIATEKEFRELDKRLGAAVLPEEVGDESQDLKPLRQYLSELSANRQQLYEYGLTAVQNDFLPVRDALELTKDDWSQVQYGVRFFSSQEERDRVASDVERDLRLYRISERDYAVASGLLDMLIGLVDVDTSDELLKKLDKNGNGSVELSELPPEWPDLPRSGPRRSNESGEEILGDQPAAEPAENARIPGSLKIDVVLKDVRDAAKRLKDKFSRTAQSLEVLQAGLRGEAVTLNRFSLDSISGTPDIEEVVRIGLEQRHDLMNARARVMDSRRAVEIAANRLEAALDVTMDGSVGLSGGNSDSSQYRAGLRFTTPLDQVSERNAYSRAIVTYQRERRAYMLLEDQVKQQIRASWRQLEVQKERLEIDRQTVRNAARQYDNASLNAARGAQQNALSLLNALDTVLQAQNSLVADWTSYETNRLNIFRDMGIMQIDPRGLWQDEFYLSMDTRPIEANSNGPAEQPVPPAPNTTDITPNTTDADAAASGPPTAENPN
ncbi:MAG: TolC family protein [Planctomyces sp.]|nr:TolC family protein [Planctomyces sp.]